MRIRDGLMIAVRNLKKRKGRTLLTALGVMIGTAAIVSMLSLGIGLERSARESLGDFGDLSILEVYPGWEQRDPTRQHTVRPEDIRMLEGLPGVEAVMPVVRYHGASEIQLGRQFSRASVEGIDFSKAALFGYLPEEGTMADGTGREAVVSSRFPYDFYEKTRQRPDRSNPEGTPAAPAYDYGMPGGGGRIPVLDQTVTVILEQYTGIEELRRKEQRVRITGVLQETRGIYGATIFLPLETVEEMNVWIQGTTGTGRRDDQAAGYQSVKVKVASNDLVPGVVEGIRAGGLETWSPTDMIEELNRTFLMIQLILGGIGSVALLVATIGIVNTMSMSILERNREIGIMKVVGATIPNIRLLFLVESGLIGLSGGIGGILASLGVVALVNSAGRSMGGMGMPSSLAVVPWWLAAAALGFSIVVGIVAGLYPANRAAAVSPLEAIRNE